jgi:hypothetical protein
MVTPPPHQHLVPIDFWQQHISEEGQLSNGCKVFGSYLRCRSARVAWGTRRDIVDTPVYCSLPKRLCSVLHAEKERKLLSFVCFARVGE